MNKRIRTLSVAAALVLAAGAGHVAAQGVGQRMDADASRFANVRVLSFEQLERIAAREMAQVVELEVKDLTLKAKGYDAQGMKVDVLLDRRDGYVLSRRVKYPKHMRYVVPAGTAPAVIQR